MNSYLLVENEKVWKTSQRKSFLDDRDNWRSAKIIKVQQSNA
jgi:hypothetical protein